MTHQDHGIILVDLFHNATDSTLLQFDRGLAEISKTNRGSVLAD